MVLEGARLRHRRRSWPPAPRIVQLVYSPAMTHNRFFQSGAVIAWRDNRKGRIGAAVPLRVVEDGPEQIVGWLATGSHFYLPADRNGNLVKDVLDWEKLTELTWQTPDESPGQLIVAPRGEQFSVIVRFVGPAMRLASWYVNLQAPFWRTPIGYDSTDHVLDVVIAADRQSWSWKDQSEFDAAVARGYLSAEERKMIREAGLRAVELAQRGAPPFLNRWENWRPDPSWPVPALPDGWDRIP